MLTYFECQVNRLLKQPHGGIDIHTRFIKALLSTQPKSILRVIVHNILGREERGGRGGGRREKEGGSEGGDGGRE